MVWVEATEGTKVLYVLGSLLVFLWIFAKMTMGRCKDNVLLVGKTALVTGGNSGIGYQIALNLAGRGCRVIIADRNNSDESVAKIQRETNNQNVTSKMFDLASLDSVRQFAKEINQTEDRLDILFNNAGTSGLGNQYSKDNLHLLMQINHFGPFLLTHLLVDLLKKSAPSRIVFQSSVLAYTANLSLDSWCLQLPKDSEKGYFFTDFFNYSNSKLCNLVTANGFAKLLRSHEVTANSTNPGVVITPIYNYFMKTNNMGNIIKWLLYSVVLKMYGKTPEEGAQTGIYLSMSKEVDGVGGKYFAECGEARVLPWKAKSRELCRRIWEESERLVKLGEEDKLGNPFE